ncbi:MAG: hypothetical protein ACXVSE_08420 [Solirubrobacteraceae bacterium]
MSAARSVRATWSLAAGAVLVSALTGCATTMQEAARLQLNAARIRTSEVATHVRSSGGAVQVLHVARVRGGGRTAFIVEVRNRGNRAIADLPISVGVRGAHGRRIEVNALSSQEDSYFDAHLPGIPAGGTLTWVYTTARRLPPHARPFALVAARPDPPVSVTATVPVIRAQAKAAGGAELTVALRNLSSVPQYQLQVYAVARSEGRYLAAGSLTVPHLGSESVRTVRLPVVGNPGGAALAVEALPTILN